MVSYIDHCVTRMNEVKIRRVDVQDQTTLGCILAANFYDYGLVAGSICSMVAAIVLVA